jgi:hypothetical protein
MCAPSDALPAETQAAQQTETLNCLTRVLRACGFEVAVHTEPAFSATALLIAMNQYDDDAPHVNVTVRRLSQRLRSTRTEEIAYFRGYLQYLQDIFRTGYLQDTHRLISP